jgi:hypothetical protein
MSGVGHWSGLWEQGDVGLHDAPAFGEADPDLALTAACRAAFELEGDGGEVAPEGGDVEAGDGAGEACGGARFAEDLEFFGAVEVFGDTEAHDLGAGPEHADEGIDVIGDEGLLVVRVEGCEFGDDGGVVDGHSKSESQRTRRKKREHREVSGLGRGYAGGGFVC